MTEEMRHDTTRHETNSQAGSLGISATRACFLSARGGGLPERLRPARRMGPSPQARRAGDKLSQTIVSDNPLPPHFKPRSGPSGRRSSRPER